MILFTTPSEFLTIFISILYTSYNLFFTSYSFFFFLSLPFNFLFRYFSSFTCQLLRQCSPVRRYITFAEDSCVYYLLDTCVRRREWEIHELTKMSNNDLSRLIASIFLYSLRCLGQRCLSKNSITDKRACGFAGSHLIVGFVINIETWFS